MMRPTDVRPASPVTLLLIAGALTLLGALAPDPASAQIERGRRFSASGDCVKCHEMTDQFARRVRHEPFDDKDCGGCHKPHGMVGALRLKETGRALCYLCHDADALGMNAAVMHQPVAAGRCEQCHDPHAADHPALLTASVTEGCYGCHERAEYEREHVHAPLADGCFSCHAVHGKNGGPRPKHLGRGR